MKRLVLDLVGFAAFVFALLGLSHKDDSTCEAPEKRCSDGPPITCTNCGHENYMVW